MKRKILVVLMAVMVATPCLAQEVEPDGLFSIEGTAWQVCRIGIRNSTYCKGDYGSDTDYA